MPILKNPRHEQFAHKFIELGDATKAMVAVYPKRASWRDDAKWVAASKLLSHPKISERVKELQDELKSKGIITAEQILQLCAKVIGGEQITDYQEARSGKATMARTIPKTWAIERVCKMLGFDKPTEVNLTKNEPEMSREDMIREIERLQGTRK